MFFHLCTYTCQILQAVDHSDSLWMLLVSWLVCLFSFCPTQLVWSWREILQLIPILFCPQPAYTPMLTTLPGKRSRLPWPHVLWSHSNHHPQFQKPPFPAPFPTGLKKNLNLIVFSLLSHSLPRCSFHMLSTLVWGVPVRLDYVQNPLPKIIYMDHWPRNDQHSPTRLPFSSKQTIFHAHFPSHHMTWLPICQHTWTKKESNTFIPILFNVPFFPQTMLCSPSFSDHIPSFYLNDFSLW